MLCSASEVGISNILHKERRCGFQKPASVPSRLPPFAARTAGKCAAERATDSRGWRDLHRASARVRGGHLSSIPTSGGQYLRPTSSYPIFGGSAFQANDDEPNDRGSRETQAKLSSRPMQPFSETPTLRPASASATRDCGGRCFGARTT